MPGDGDACGRVAGEDLGAPSSWAQARCHARRSPGLIVESTASRRQRVREREGESGIVVGEDPLTDGLGDRVGERAVIGARATRVVTVLVDILQEVVVEVAVPVEQQVQSGVDLPLIEVRPLVVRGV